MPVTPSDRDGIAAERRIVFRAVLGVTERPFSAPRQPLPPHDSVQLVTLGLLAEMQTRTYHQSQNKPTYVIREVLEEPPARMTVRI